MGLNALLERRGAVTGIITNCGFRDVFLIGRANVPDAEMFNFRWEKPKLTRLDEPAAIAR